MKENKLVKIYTLTDPINFSVRYVGKTSCSLEDRLAKHMCTKEKNHRGNYIRSLKVKGLKPIIDLVEEVPLENWVFWERYWISQFLNWGFPLVNLTQGGESGVISKQCREACIKANKNRINRKGVTPSDEVKAKISIKLKGRKLSKETLEKRSESTKGRKLSQLNKNRIGIANSIKVAKYDKNEKLLKVYSSFTEAAKDINGSVSKISLVCSGKRNFHKGFIFKKLK